MFEVGNRSGSGPHGDHLVSDLAAGWLGFRLNVLADAPSGLYTFSLRGILVWRLFFFQSTRRATNLDVLLAGMAVCRSAPLMQVGIETIKDIIETTVLAWSVPFYQFVAAGNYRDLPSEHSWPWWCCCVLFLAPGLPKPWLGPRRARQHHIHMIGIGCG